jgi:hypothetical protein
MKKVLICFVTAAAVWTADVPRAAGQQPDVLLAPVGGSGGNTFQARCAPGEHLIGLNLRAGHNVDAVQPICGSTSNPSGPMTIGREMPRFGGQGGEPKQLICPSNTPAVIAMHVSAEGVGVVALKAIYLYCGVVAAQQILSEVASASFVGPSQHQNILPGTSDVRSSSGYKICPGGLIPVGAHGRAGALVDALGLICGAPQLVEDRSGRTLGKRRRADVTAGRTLGKRRPGGDTLASAGVIERMNVARLDPAIYDRYVGRYLVSPTQIMTITREGNRLYTVQNGSGGISKNEIFPETETKFVWDPQEIGRPEHMTITFELGPSGNAVALILGREGVAGSAQRIVRMPD